MKKKGFLQKASFVSGIISEIIAVICFVMLLIKSEELGPDHIISASFLASTFFFFTCGIVFLVVGRANVPSMNLDDHEELLQQEQERQQKELEQEQSSGKAP